MSMNGNLFLSLARAVPPAPGDARRAERVLATARAFLAGASLVAVYFDPTQPGRYANLAYLLFLVYVVHSVLIVILLRIRWQLTPAFVWGIHGVDVVWPVLIALFNESPNSPVFVFFSFVLLAAAYRWGFRETLATAVTAVVLLLIHVFLTSGAGSLGDSLGRELELNRWIMRGTYVLIMGFLFGYLAEQEKQLRAEPAVIAGIMGKARAENGLKAVLRVVFGDLLRVFGARRALLALQDARSGRAFLWEAGREGEPQKIRLSSCELELTRLGTYLFATRADVWYAARSDRARGGEGIDFLAIDSEGRWLRNESCPLPEDFPHGFRSNLAVSIRLGNEWSGRLFLLDPGPGARQKTELRFLQTLVAQLSPAIYNVYLLSWLRTHAEAMERSRVARELHDGIIQSLIAVEMEVQVLRRQAADGSTPIAGELARLQQILREEILNLRELMEQMKPLEMNAAELPDFLADSVSRFQQETGISARFLREFEEVALAPRVCREVARIVQEALVNVRKHSGARNVLVRFTSENGNWKLVIDDDGCGFPFSGRLSRAELDSTRKGPMVIKERVRSIGGELNVESIPGRGARLEITLARKTDG